MLKKLAVPFLALVISTLGACGSDSPASGTGGSGSGGSGTGGSGSGGSGSGGTGSGGSGSGGSGSGGAVVEAGTDMAMETAPETAAETAAETSPSSPDAAAAMCSGKTGPTSPEFSDPADFCTLVNAQCNDLLTMAALKVQATCVTTYAGWTDAQKKCRSYHLCNTLTMSKATHCPHTEGIGQCP